MLRFALRSLLANGRRAAMTGLAVVVGVSMITGTFIFTDTINSAFRQLFSNASKGAAVVVSSRQDITSAINAPASVPVSLIAKIRRLPGVSIAQGQISDVATIVGRNGKIARTAGLPTLALSYLAPPFDGLTFTAGTRPRGPDQVAIDTGTAKRQGYRVGDLVPVVTGQPVRRFRISGIASLGSASIGGATFAVFDLSTARDLYGKAGRADIVYVAAAPGATPSTLLREVRPLLSPELVARTAQGQVNSDTSRISDQLQILTGGLLAFGFIAVLVGAFVIFNTFSITITQRIREFALLRAIGATRRQVLLSVLTEATTIGLLGSIVGILGGLLAAAGIRKLFTSVGLDLPSAALVLQLRTVILGLAVGVLVTVGAGLFPAAPLESLREAAATAARGDSSQWIRAGLAAVLGVAGLLVMFTGSGTATERLTQSAVGAIPLVLAILVASPLMVRRLAGIVSWPIERRGAVVSRLARENAGRNPVRTAVSASALMIGLALVLFVTIYASGLRTSTSRIIHQTFLGDLTIQSQDGQSSIPSASAQAAASAPGVLALSSLKAAPARLGAAGKITAEGIDPNTFGQVYRFDWIHGSGTTLTGLGPGDAILEQDTARAAHLAVGDRATLVSETGLRRTVRIAGVYSDRALLRGIALPETDFDQLFHQDRLQDVFVKLQPGSSVADAEGVLNRALSSLPGVVARSEKQLADEVSGHVNSILILFYALLAMSVLMSLLGMINTLNLSIHERTRELGMLRAMGMTRGQARVLVRDESLITAAIGSIVGVALGIFLAWVVIRSLSSEGIVFALPWLQVVGVLAVGLLAGVFAAVLPARRAARLDLLAAIAHE
jgi:putative ABC transport system permease protein